MKYYTGIGSRETPDELKEPMRKYAETMARNAYRLRSGAAQGADSFFEQGAQGICDIYIPWRKFSDNHNHIVASSLPCYKEAEKIAESLHPNWQACSRGARALHTRNVFQVLGNDLQTPSEFVICWAPKMFYDKEGKICNVSGGTGQAVRLAYKYGIEVVPFLHTGLYG